MSEESGAKANYQLPVLNLRVPTIDDVVHYVSHGSPDGMYRSECRPARVTSVGGWKTVGVDAPPAKDGEQPQRTVGQVWDPMRMTLFVMNPTGVFFNECEHDAGTYTLVHGAESAGAMYRGGTWHWQISDMQRLERVERPCGVEAHGPGCQVLAKLAFQEVHSAPAAGAAVRQDA